MPDLLVVDPRDYADEEKVRRPGIGPNSPSPTARCQPSNLSLPIVAWLVEDNYTARIDVPRTPTPSVVIVNVGIIWMATLPAFDRGSPRPSARLIMALE